MLLLAVFLTSTKVLLPSTIVWCLPVPCLPSSKPFARVTDTLTDYSNPRYASMHSEVNKCNDIVEMIKCCNGNWLHWGSSGHN